MLVRGGRLAGAAILVLIIATLGSDYLGQLFNFTPSADPNNRSSNATQVEGDPAESQAAHEAHQPARYSRSAEHLTIGTFNIQVFGQSKMSKPEVVDVLVDVARQFDVLAIQELRSLDQSVVPNFVQEVNADGHRYSYVLGARQGNTRSKEQYVFLYDTTRVELLDQGYLVPDPQNLLHREPLVTTFRARTGNPASAFSFTLMNIHTDPDVVEEELNALPAFIEFVRRHNPAEDDVILLGDLNASPSDLGRLAQVPGIAAAIAPHIPTNTRGTDNYDNILFDRYRTAEFARACGVLDLISRYNLTEREALAVSDHLPVWALFTMREANSSLRSSARGRTPAYR